MSYEEFHVAVHAPAAATHYEDPDLSDILDGLSQVQKRLPTRLLYDEQGSLLFERICDLPEYEVTRTELALLRSRLREIAAFVGPGAGVIEPGAGCGCKTRLLLRALQDLRWYAPIDIDPSVLQRCRQTLREALPRLPLVPLCADFTQTWERRSLPDAQRQLLYFPGSTVGNFEADAARQLLRQFRNSTGSDGLLLLGIDLRRNAARLRRAYDDAAGITARFNLNLLTRINREHGADFDLEAFEHRVVYDKAAHRIEMHLRSRREQRVRVGGRHFRFAAGETIHTENSCKYLPRGFATMAASAGWSWSRLWLDPQRRFALMGFAAA